jgi:AraC-like DNA-binding protein
MLHQNPLPLERRSRNLSAIYLPPYCEAPAGIAAAGMMVVAWDAELPLVKVSPSVSLTPEARHRLVLVTHAVPPRRVGDKEAYDPYLFRMAQSVLCGFRRNRPPPEGYLESIAEPIAAHLEQFYFRGTREREHSGLSTSRLDRVLAFIEQNYADEVPTDGLANAAFLSPFHFRRMFKRSTGLTPHAYVTRLRVARAGDLLASTNLPIAEVGRRVGFQNQAHFSTSFRRLADMTPSRYRRLVRHGEAPELPRAGIPASAAN